ncbi:MAG: response regulator [Tepidisphaeraceae bacterium]
MSTETTLNILIVDDSATTRAMIRRIIGMLDLPSVVITEAENGAVGLERIRANPIDLVLADLNMPVMDGFQMITHLRCDDSTKTLPVVVISAQPDPEQIVLLKEIGITGYLQKPFTPESVRSLVQPILETKQAAAESTILSGGGVNLTLAEALAEALETMAFISPELVSLQPSDVPASDSRLVKIEFRGRESLGSLAIAASPGLGAAIAANLEDAGLTAADDALKELANITCGLLLRMGPEGGLGFVLDPPTLSTNAGQNPLELLHGEDVVTLRADEELIAAQVTTDSIFFVA